MLESIRRNNPLTWAGNAILGYVAAQQAGLPDEEKGYWGRWTPETWKKKIKPRNDSLRTWLAGHEQAAKQRTPGESRELLAMRQRQSQIADMLASEPRPGTTKSLSFGKAAGDQEAGHQD